MERRSINQRKQALEMPIETGKGKETVSPLEPPEGAHELGFQLQNSHFRLGALEPCNRVNVCCFKPAAEIAVICYSSLEKNNTLALLFFSRSVVSDCHPHELQPARLFCLWDSPGKNTGVACHFPTQGIFPTQESNICLLHWQVSSLLTEPPGKPHYDC